jgi:hypothetical protein
VPKYASNVKLLLALNIWHPNNSSTFRFVRATLQIMKQYESKEQFNNSLTKLGSCVEQVETSL